MEIKKRIALGIALYILLCIFDYMFNQTFNWKSNILIAVVGMVISWIVIEILPNNKKIRG
jgi:multisubunit Na+/H+ antiporter MnhE subunit